MLLDLVGGGMNAEPDWALSVAELEQLGICERSARLAVGVPPSFDLEGRWVLLVDDEPFDPKTSRVIEIAGDGAVCSRGARGVVTRLRKKALVRFPSDRGRMEECIAITAAPAPDYLYGMAYIDEDLPDGDPGSLWHTEAAEVPDQLPMADAIWLYREETASQGR